MSIGIVTVQVFQVQAPTPPSLQQTGAFISQGATILANNNFSLLTQLSDLTPLLEGIASLSGLTWASGLVTATTTSPHGFTVGDYMYLSIAGAVPTSYNGTFLCSITGASTFTYPLALNPGLETAPGSYTPEDVAELLAMATTFFAQGNQLSVYVLELGDGDPADGVTALTAYLTANPNTSYTPGATGYFYIYLVPRTWAAEPTYIAMLANYESTTARTYFFTTATLASYVGFTPLMKDALVLVEDPEFVLYSQNALSALTFTGDITAVSATVATAQSGIGSYAPADVATVAGGTGTEPTWTINTTQFVSAVVNAAGSGGTPGLTTFTGTTGTGTKFQVSGTIGAGGTLSGALTVVLAGNYTVNPTSLLSEPITGGALTGATLTIKMGALGITLLTAGALSATPANPVATTDSGAGTGLTLNVVWSYVAVDGFITGTTTTAHGVPVGATFQLQGFVPNGYNGFYVAELGTVGSTLIAALAANPGAVTTLGVLEAGNVASSGTPVTEFTLAAAMWVALSNNPSSTNKMRPFAFSFLFGVTPWPSRYVNATLTTLKNASVNYVQVAAEGGITNTALYWGTTMDARDFSYWFSVDWMAIQSDLNIANAVINGSNNAVNPLYYNQEGINRLQDVVVSTAKSAVTLGLATGQVVATNLDGPAFTLALDAGTYAGQIVVNAVPFVPYLTANPGDYKIGKYGGLSVQYIPTRGFISILFNIYVTDFIAP